MERIAIETQLKAKKLSKELVARLAVERRAGKGEKASPKAESKAAAKPAAKVARKLMGKTKARREASRWQAWTMPGLTMTNPQRQVRSHGLLSLGQMTGQNGPRMPEHRG